MSRSKNMIIWLLRSLLILAILVMIIIVFAPRLINLEAVRRTVADRLSREVGGQMSYGHIGLSYFPRPHAVIYKARISLPESFTVKIHRLRIYPKILPLLKGRLQPDIVKLEYADYFMILPQISDGRQTPEEILPFDHIVKTITKAVRSLPEFTLPELNLRMKYGKVNLVDPFGHKFKLREVTAHYSRSPDKFDFSIECKSNLWDRIHIAGALDPLEFKGRGHIQLSQFRPRALFAYLFPHSALQVTDAGANLAIDLKLDGSGQMTADVNGDTAFLELSQGSEKLNVKGSSIKGSVQVGGKTATITMTELGLDYPKINLSGTLFYDENQQDIQLTVKSSGIDVDASRYVALKLAGESETIRNLFDIVRGGEVARMTVLARGRTITDLGNLDNFVIQGQMTKGKLFIPVVKLDLTDVVGNATISGGILQAENIGARTGRTLGQNGTLKLGLNEDLAPFHLRVHVNADLSQLPPVLGRIVDDKDFRNELALIKAFKGSATGVLTLGDDLARLAAKVTVSKVHLTARYKRIPYPIKIDGGPFMFEGSRISFQNFNASVGKSWLSQLSSSIDWAKAASLNAKSKTAKFDLDELYSWLQSFDRLKYNLNPIRSLNGRVSVQNLTIRGPLMRPQIWRFQTRGVVDNLVVNSARLPKPLAVARGQFSWQGTQIAFNDVDATMGKSSVVQISGNANWGKTPTLSTKSGPALFYLEDITPFIDAIKNLSAPLNQFQPLNGTLAFQGMAMSCPLSGPTYRQLSFSADIKQLMIKSKGLPRSLHVNQGRFSWRNTQLALRNIDALLGKSKITQLSVSIDWNKTSYFEVHSETLTLFADEIYPWLSSFEKFQTALKDVSATSGILGLHGLNVKGPIHQPAAWQYRLTGKMQNLVVTSNVFAGPLTVTDGAFDIGSQFSSDAVKNRVNVKTTNLTWGENHLTLMGGMTVSKKSILLDMNISADGLDWNQIKTILDYIEKQNADSNRRDWGGQLRGTLNVQSDSFNYESYTARPLEAEVSFKPDKVIIAINKALLCNISVRGLLKISEQMLDVYFVPAATNQKLDPTLLCMTDIKDFASGIYSLNGELMAKTRPGTFPRSLAGKVYFSAEKGRIYRLGLLSKILAILNVTEIYRGQIPDLTGDGFEYRSMKIGANIQAGKIIMEECAIDGTSMGIACEGNIDIADKKMDLVILVAPFKTVDRILEHIPLVSQILGGKLISIPFSAKGDLKDPEVIMLPPTAVGSGVLGILERTLKLPITIIQPVLPKGNNQKNNQKQPEFDPYRGP